MFIRLHIAAAAIVIAAGACGASIAGPEAVGTLKSKPDGSAGDLYGVVVSHATHSYLYVQERDGSCGIRVNASGDGFVRGDIVNLSGVIWTDYWYERYLQPSSIQRANRTVVPPVSLPTRAVGGGDWFYNRIARSGQRGVSGGRGLNNIGLLVKVAGRVTAVAGPSFFLDDGSGRVGGNGEAGLMVFADDAPPPAVGDYAVVVGVVAAARYSVGVYPRILSGPGGISVL